MKVGVIGSGTMGIGLTQLFAQSDFIESTTWFLGNNSSFEEVFKKLATRWSSAVNKGKISQNDYNRFTSKIIAVDDYRAIRGLDFVIEAVTESMETKKQVLQRAAEYIEPNTIYATNTSSLSVTEISSVAKFKENVIGLHFFNPAPVMKLTEVVSGFLTGERTKSFAFDFAVRLGKEPVFVNEAPGFVVNRMLIPMINEAIAVFAEGVASAKDIDTALINGANHPIGPLSLADLIGTDVCLSIMEVLHSETGDPKYRAHPLLRKMVRAGKLGKKSGEGFFTYL
jgi:3-hydroxybutyryl-CoA dehydrogenase